MSSVVEVSQVMGPMWSIAGRAIVVPSGESVPVSAAPRFGTTGPLTTEAHVTATWGIA